MPSPRVTPIEPPYPADLQASFDTIMQGAPPLALFRTVARNPRVLKRMLAGGLLDRGSISLRSRELMILRTCARCGAEYEWGVHIATFGAKAQWTPEQTRSTVTAVPKMRAGQRRIASSSGSPTSCTRRAASTTRCGLRPPPTLPTSS